jgi:hypothetical protein
MNDVVDVNSIETAGELLSYLRKGNSQKFEIGFADWKAPCRLLSASEMLTLTIRAQAIAKGKNPTGVRQESFNAIEAMILILDKATTISGAPFFAMGFLESLPETLLSDLYDQFLTINNTINPNINSLKPHEIQAIVETVKKKNATTKDYFTWQLAEVGRFFLEEIVPILPTDKEPGLPL